MPPKIDVNEGQRGGDDTMEVLSIINDLTDEEGAYIFNMPLGNSN